MHEYTTEKTQIYDKKRQKEQKSKGRRNRVYQRKRSKKVRNNEKRVLRGSGTILIKGPRLVRKTLELVSSGGLCGILGLCLVFVFVTFELVKLPVLNETKDVLHSIGPRDVWRILPPSRKFYYSASFHASFCFLQPLNWASLLGLRIVLKLVTVSPLNFKKTKYLKRYLNG